MLRDVADVVDGLENTKVGGWYQRPAGRDHRHPPPARRERRADGREHPGRAAAAARALPVGAKLTVVQRPHRHDPRLDPRRAVHARAGVALVVLVVLIFLRTIRATIIAGVALPLSLIATFRVMWFAASRSTICR